MAKIIITNSHDDFSNVLIELDNGEQVEIDAYWEDLMSALKDDGQTIIEGRQVQPKENSSKFKFRHGEKSQIYNAHKIIDITGENLVYIISWDDEEEFHSILQSVEVVEENLRLGIWRKVEI